jgi:hypothetical protein
MTGGSVTKIRTGNSRNKNSQHYNYISSFGDDCFNAVVPRTSGLMRNCGAPVYSRKATVRKIVQGGRVHPADYQAVKSALFRLRV